MAVGGDERGRAGGGGGCGSVVDYFLFLLIPC